MNNLNNDVCIAIAQSLFDRHDLISLSLTSKKWGNICKAAEVRFHWLKRLYKGNLLFHAIRLGKFDNLN